MLCQTLPFSEVTPSYTYTHSFFIFFSIMVYHRMLSLQCNTVAPRGRSVLYVSLRLSSPNSPSLSIRPLPCPPTPAPASTSLFSAPMGLFQRQISVEGDRGFLHSNRGVRNSQLGPWGFSLQTGNPSSGPHLTCPFLSQFDGAKVNKAFLFL